MPPVVPAARSVDTVEALEDPVEVASGDADALVGDHDLDRLVVDTGAHLDDVAVVAVLDGVLDQVADRRDELAAVGAQPNRPRHCRTR